MFLITPKARANPSPEDTSAPLPPRSSRPIAKIGRIRASKACDRCRVKKIKCDGVVPCLRCTHDDVVCMHLPKEPGNRAEASRQYISSLEMQQRSLVDTLQKMSRAIPQAINADELRQLLETLRTHGCVIEGVSDAMDSINSEQDFTGNYHDTQPPPHKRKRGSSSLIHNEHIIPSGEEADGIWEEKGTDSAILPPVEQAKVTQTPTPAAPINTTSQWSVEDLYQLASNPQLDPPLCNPPTQYAPPLSTSPDQHMPNPPPPWPADTSMWDFDAPLVPAMGRAAATMLDAAYPQSNSDVGFLQTPTALMSADWSDLWWDPSLILTGDFIQPDSLGGNGLLS